MLHRAKFRPVECTFPCRPIKLGGGCDAIGLFGTPLLYLLACPLVRPEIHPPHVGDSGKYPMQTCLNALKPVKKQHFGAKALTPGARRDLINHQLKRVALTCQISACALKGKNFS
jgi:hypothetical protein